MSFSQMLEMLQEENKGKIVLCNAGNFYIAVGRDAVFLNKELGLKVSCFKEELCKVGFPLQALEKYTNILKEKDYSFIVYNFNREKIELKKILINEGKKKNGEINERLNCYICKHSCKYYKKEDIYLRAMVELQRKEMEIQKKEEEKNIKKEKDKKEKRRIWFINKNKKIN